MKDNKFKSFKEFYLYYLMEHKKSSTKLFHAIGTLLGLVSLILFIYFKQYNYMFVSLIPGYSFAWFSHAVFEKNKPATFKYPLFSFLGDWFMLKDILIGKIKL
ncbi:MAG: hypothetical protein CMG64_05950 [Candidatus Marinimicrobia bacterium]|nr:hypothetical protein [Candidatus Neomarinimicrobiota bacterium]|tara:strand:- start:27428 stop:27736 length:309 start_codon:yes stop_codon:yes gene_type:complete